MEFGFWNLRPIVKSRVKKEGIRLFMNHRHINVDIEKGLPLEAIDDIISRGEMPEWRELRDYVLYHPEILDDIIKICSHYIADPYEQKYLFWYNLGLYLKLCVKNIKSLRNESKEFIDMFDLMINHNYNFNNIELYGVTFYCFLSLEESGDIINKLSVWQQFTGWKGKKFAKKQALESLNKIQTLKKVWNEKYNNQHFDILN